MSATSFVFVLLLFMFPLLTFNGAISRFQYNWNDGSKESSPCHALIARRTSNVPIWEILRTRFHYNREGALRLRRLLGCREVDLPGLGSRIDLTHELRPTLGVRIAIPHAVVLLEKVTV